MIDCSLRNRIFDWSEAKTVFYIFVSGVAAGVNRALSFS